jgi:hypothetical protein
MSLPQGFCSFNTASPSGGVRLVDGTGEALPNGASFSFTDSSLNVPVKAGDLVIAFLGVAGSFNVSGVKPSGFTTIASGYANDTYDASANVSYKVLTSDSLGTVTFPFTNSAFSNAGFIMVFRGASVPSSWNFSVKDRTSSDDPQFDALPNSLNSSTSMVVRAGVTAHVAGANRMLSDTGLNYVVQDEANDTYDVSAALGVQFRALTSSTYNWFCSGSGAASSCVAIQVEIPV